MRLNYSGHHTIAGMTSEIIKVGREPAITDDRLRLILRRMRQRAFVILNPDHARGDSRRKVASKIMICLANAPLVGALVGMLLVAMRCRKR